jgi:hypothetical protein
MRADHEGDGDQRASSAIIPPAPLAGETKRRLRRMRA